MLTIVEGRILNGKVVEFLAKMLRGIKERPECGEVNLEDSVVGTEDADISVEDEGE